MTQNDVQSKEINLGTLRNLTGVKMSVDKPLTFSRDIQGYANFISVYGNGRKNLQALSFGHVSREFDCQNDAHKVQVYPCDNFVGNYHRTDAISCIDSSNVQISNVVCFDLLQSDADNDVIAETAKSDTVFDNANLLFARSCKFLPNWSVLHLKFFGFCESLAPKHCSYSKPLFLTHNPLLLHALFVMYILVYSFTDFASPLILFSWWRNKIS